MACGAVIRLCQSAGAIRSVTVDWTGMYALLWEPGEVRAVGEVVRPTQANGWQYRATTAGQSSMIEPEWPIGIEGDLETAARVVNDGSVIWEAEAVSDDSLSATVAASVWSGDTGLVITGPGVQSMQGEIKTWAKIQAAARGHYQLLNSVRFSNGAEDVVEIRVKIQ